MFVEPEETDNQIVRRAEMADAEEFAALLTRPSDREEHALRAHLGEGRYVRLKRLVLAQAIGPWGGRGLFDGVFGPADRTGPVPLGNVMILPGLMGSALTMGPDGPGDPIWLSYWQIALGRIARLRLAPDGVHGAERRDEARPSGVLKRYYGTLQLTLQRAWNVHTFAFDWRKGLDESADGLAEAIRQSFGERDPVHLLTHSMGGLVARSFIRRHPKLWERMWDNAAQAPGVRGGRLVMLGTPNYGSYLAVQALAGLALTVRSLARLDLRNDLDAIRGIVASFPGLLQLLPSPMVDRGASRLFEASLYREIGLGVAQSQLDRAREQHELLAEPEDPERFLYVAGSGQPTIGGISEYDAITEPASYQATTQGDGSVTHHLGFLKGVKTYFVEEEHSALPSNGRVLGALDALLSRGETSGLSSVSEATRSRSIRPRENLAKRRDLAIGIERRRLESIDRIDRLIERSRADGLIPALDRGGNDARGSLDQPGVHFWETDETREIEDLLVRGWLGEASTPADPTVPEEDPGGSEGDPKIEIGLAYAKIEGASDAVAPRVDAIAVGHYLGMRPSGTEEAIDVAISGKDCRQEERILNQFAMRGVIRGELGQSFFLQDPNNRDLLVAVAGMGTPGRCGAPELTVVVRELCWALGRLGKRHLATVLIGAGEGNLSIDEAVGAWLRGIEQALGQSPSEPSGHLDGQSPSEPSGHLKRITFVEYDPRRMVEIKGALGRSRDRQETGLTFEAPVIGPDELERLGSAFVGRSHKGWESIVEGETSDEDPEPTRLAVGVENDPDAPGHGIYRFSALTRWAAVPERAVPVDLELVGRGNDLIALEADPNRQYDRGRYLEELLVPDDLREHLSSTVPLVIQLDSQSARVHWEMVAQPDPLRRGSEPRGRAVGTTRTDALPFLGLARGLTRQLRTSFAGPPEPPPPPNATLDLLLIADPAEEEELRLPWAEREGVMLTELFESYNRLAEAAGMADRVRLKAMIGPRDANRTDVLSELLIRRYDVVHYAGHCRFDAEHPDRSGWVFSGDRLLTTRELSRIDRVPRLVVSNACETGVTAGRPSRPSPGLAPGFAEAFFARGVSDFVCTAWRIDDRAALLFAASLYSQLLGIRWDGKRSDFVLDSPRPMYVAMREARRALFLDGAGGRRTWGAYQHYGNPFYRVFARRD